MTVTLTKLPAWHEGEKFIQEKVGVAERMAAVGQRVVRDYMPDEHRDFYAQLPFVVLGSVDPEGDPWATLLVGKPGFMSSPAPTALDIAAQADPGDPAAAGMRDGDPIGLLGIEMHTRRRNRMNGILAVGGGGFRVDVDQSFGNCPRYIQLREFDFARDPAETFTGAVEELPQLDLPARTMIEAADAFFVATYADRKERRQVDVSHRGGKAGFVRIAGDGTLTVPDFNGNLFFSTLGNIVLNGKAGLVFIDYESGDMLQMTGDAAVVLDSPEIAAFQGAERLWTFRPRRILRRPSALALRWSMRQDAWSPSSLLTGIGPRWPLVCRRPNSRSMAALQGGEDRRGEPVDPLLPPGAGRWGGSTSPCRRPASADPRDRSRRGQARHSDLHAVRGPVRRSVPHQRQAGRRGVASPSRYHARRRRHRGSRARRSVHHRPLRDKARRPSGRRYRDHPVARNAA